jgi:hypothetical protein
MRDIERAAPLTKSDFAAAAGYGWRTLRPIVLQHGIGTNVNGRWRFDPDDVATVKAIIRVQPCSTSTADLPVSTVCAGLTTGSKLTEALTLARLQKQKRSAKNGSAKSSRRSSTAKGPAQRSPNLRLISSAQDVR